MQGYKVSIQVTDKSGFQEATGMNVSELALAPVDPLWLSCCTQEVSQDELYQWAFLPYGFWLGSVKGSPGIKSKGWKKSCPSWFLTEPGAACYLWPPLTCWNTTLSSPDFSNCSPHLPLQAQGCLIEPCPYQLLGNNYPLGLFLHPLYNSMSSHKLSKSVVSCWDS